MENLTTQQKEARAEISRIMEDCDEDEPTRISELKEACSVFGDGFEFLDEAKKFYPYTCVQYCMECTEDHIERYNRWMDVFKQVTLFRPASEVRKDPVFLRWLIDSSHLMEVPKDEAQFVTYWVDGEVVHIGKLVEDNLVESKWGHGGPLTRHRTFHVSSAYGNDAKYHRWSAKHDILKLLQLFWDEVVPQDQK